MIGNHPGDREELLRAVPNEVVGEDVAAWRTPAARASTPSGSDSRSVYRDRLGVSLFLGSQVERFRAPAGWRFPAQRSKRRSRAPRLSRIPFILDPNWIKSVAD